MECQAALAATAGGARRAPRVSFGGVEDDRDMSWLFGGSDDSDDSDDSDAAVEAALAAPGGFVGLAGGPRPSEHNL